MDDENKETVTPMPAADNVVPSNVEKKTNKKPLLILSLVVVALVAGLLLAVKMLSKTAPETTMVKKHIPLLKHAALEGPYNTPYPTSGTHNPEYMVNIHTFEGLTGFGEKSRIEPRLASKWSNPDDNTWVFTLKEGVKFHNGREMTAEDVKFSLENPAEEYAGLYAGTIDSVTVSDPMEITIKTKDPDPTLVNKLSFLFIYDSKSETPNSFTNGTGPYTLKEGTVNDTENLDLVAFDGYHGDEIYVDEIQFKAFTDLDKLTQAYQSGEADVVQLSQRTDTAKGLADTAQVIELGDLGVSFLIVNSSRDNALSDLKVRKAIQLGMDVESLMKVREVDGIPTGQIIPELIPGYDNSIKIVERDVKAAKALLAETDYSASDLTFEFTYFAPSEATAKEIARQLAEVGVTLTLNPTSDVKQLGPVVFGGKTDMSFITYSTDILDGSDILESWYRSGPLYDNPEIDSLLDENAKTFDQAKRIELMQAANRKASEDVAMVPLFKQGSSYVITKPEYKVSPHIPTVYGIFWNRVHTLEEVQK